MLSAIRAYVMQGAPIFVKPQHNIRKIKGNIRMFF